LSSLCAGLPGARWVDPDGMHITLRFIGEVDEVQAEEVHEALAKIEARAFDISLAGVGTFGTGKKVRAVWVGVAAPPDLGHLQSKVNAAVTRGAGLPPEGRKFTPHVTLARFNSRVDEARLHMFAAANNLFRVGPVRVDSFTLYLSEMGHGGSVYTPLADYDLSG
jgi:2'-5' RNA ligase